MHLPADAVPAITRDDAELAVVRASAARVPSSMACETSVSRLPGSMAAMPASMDSRVASDSASSTGMSAPMPNVNAESPCQPSRMAPQSMDTRSPAPAFRRPTGCRARRGR